MNGAESLVRTLLANGIDVCFANPGTSEMHFVAALDRVEGMWCILGMAEIVVTGCADGYGRMAGKPAATLLHCVPGRDSRRGETAAGVLCLSGQAQPRFATGFDNPRPGAAGAGGCRCAGVAG